MKCLSLPVLSSLVFTMISCTPTESVTVTTEKPMDTTTTTQEPKSTEPATPTKATEEVAVIETNLGNIVVTFFPDKAPKHVANFKELAKKGFYDGTKFHRVIPDFMIQGGDPNSKSDDRSTHGMGGPGHSVKAEFNNTKHVRGILSAARSGHPDSAGSQFFIMVSDKTHLDGQYSAFGKVLEGMDVVDKIVALDRDANDNPLPKNPAIIKSIKIEERKPA